MVNPQAQRVVTKSKLPPIELCSENLTGRTKGLNHQALLVRERTPPLKHARKDSCLTTSSPKVSDLAYLLRSPMKSRIAGLQQPETRDTHQPDLRKMLVPPQECSISREQKLTVNLHWLAP